MACKRCSSNKQSEFNAEMNIHFAGREGVDKPTVWLFPEIMVCLDCGFAEFTIPKVELLSLARDHAV